MVTENVMTNFDWNGVVETGLMMGLWYLGIGFVLGAAMMGLDAYASAKGGEPTENENVYLRLRGAGASPTKARMGVAYVVVASSLSWPQGLYAIFEVVWNDVRKTPSDEDMRDIAKLEAFAERLKSGGMGSVSLNEAKAARALANRLSKKMRGGEMRPLLLKLSVAMGEALNGLFEGHRMTTERVEEMLAAAKRDGVDVPEDVVKLMKVRAKAVDEKVERERMAAVARMKEHGPKNDFKGRFTKREDGEGGA